MSSDAMHADLFKQQNLDPGQQFKVFAAELVGRIRALYCWY